MIVDALKKCDERETSRMVFMLPLGANPMLLSTDGASAVGCGFLSQSRAKALNEGSRNRKLGINSKMLYWCR